MKLPTTKPFLIAIIVIIAVIGVGAGVLGTQSHTNTIQPVQNQTQEQLNDSQMMKNLENQSDSENIKINEASDITGDVSNDEIKLTATLPVVKAQEVTAVDDGTLIKVVKIVKVPYQVKVPYKVKKAYKVKKKYKLKVKYKSKGKTKYKYVTKYKKVTKYKYVTKYRYETRYKDVEQITYETPSTEWDPLENPGENPDADDYDNDGSDSGEDQSGDTGF